MCAEYKALLCELHTCAPGRTTKPCTLSPRPEPVTAPARCPAAQGWRRDARDLRSLLPAPAGEGCRQEATCPPLQRNTRLGRSGRASDGIDLIICLCTASWMRRGWGGICRRMRKGAGARRRCSREAGQRPLSPNLGSRRPASTYQAHDLSPYELPKFVDPEEECEASSPGTPSGLHRALLYKASMR